MSSPAQSGWLLERPDHPHGNFEVVFACPDDADVTAGRMGHYYDDVSAHPPESLEWQVAELEIYERSLPGPFFGAAMILSNYGNLELVAAQADGRVVHSPLEGILGWQGPTSLPGNIGAGAPAFIQSRYGGVGNFEVIVPHRDGGLAHFWRDNDHGEVWHEASRPTTAGRWSGVGLIHSGYGNLELVGVVDGALVFMWQNGAGGPWSAPATLATGAMGRPGFIQSTYGGTNGNFEVVYGRNDGGLAHVWRDNTSNDLRWSAPVNFDERFGTTQRFRDVTLIQSSFGYLEVLARGDRSTLVSAFRAAHGAPWEEPTVPWGFSC